MKTKWNMYNMKEVIENNNHKSEKLDESCSSISFVTITCNKCKYYRNIKFKHYLEKGLSCFCSDKIYWHYDMVRSFIASKGEILLSDNYINTKELLKIQCQYCKLEYEQNFIRYKKGYRHNNCQDNNYKLSHKKQITYINQICAFCKKPFHIPFSKRWKKMCSDVCLQSRKMELGKSEKHKFQCRKGGLASVRNQNKRSKNEVYFAELCKKHFDNVLENPQMFDGWDADVVLPELKIAVNWNGIWHYKQVMPEHNLKNVQHRDELKWKMIIENGYTPYDIKDLGKHDKKFVEAEFFTFLNYIEFMIFFD